MELVNKNRLYDQRLGMIAECELDEYSRGWNNCNKYWFDVFNKMKPDLIVHSPLDEMRIAFEKQIHQKPIFSGYKYNGFGEETPTKAFCPACGFEFEFGTWNEEDNHHCVCGQAIKWED